MRSGWIGHVAIDAGMLCAVFCGTRAILKYYSQPIHYAVQLIPTERCPLCNVDHLRLADPFGMVNGRLVMSCNSKDLLGYYPKQPLDCVVISDTNDVMGYVKGTSVTVVSPFTKSQVLSRIKILQWADLDLDAEQHYAIGTEIF